MTDNELMLLKMVQEANAKISALEERMGYKTCNFKTVTGLNMWPEHLRPERRLVGTMQGKPVYTGDKYWFVAPSTFELGESTIPEWAHTWSLNNLIEYFTTKDEAEKYIIDNKPAVPWGLVEKLAEVDEETFYAWVWNLKHDLKKYNPRPKFKLK